MAWSFGESWDCYAAPADMLNGYWDSGTVVANITLPAGRFAGSQAIQIGANNNSLIKTSAVNDAVHHFIFAFRQTAAISGTTLGCFLELFDGATAQCSVVFRSDGAMLLTAGGPAGTVLATYTGAVSVASTWYVFEVEVVISNTAGWMKVRKNGNTTEDFTSALNLDTQVSASAYANKLTLGMQASVSSQQFDDLYWRSDASSLPWFGDIRCYTRAPASDAAVQFSRTPTSNTQTPFTANSFLTPTATTASYTPIVAAYDGTVSAVVASFNNALTGDVKCAVYNSTAGAPTTVIVSAATITNPTAGNVTFTFTTPFAVTKGTQYWIGFQTSTTGSNVFNSSNAGTQGRTSTTAYAAFPVTSPTPLTNGLAVIISWTIAVGNNATVVNEAQQDATTSYVYDSVPGHADLYGIAAIASTPLTTFAVTTRAYMIKSDAGTRTAAVQLKSGATTDASPTVVLTPSNWQWAWKHYPFDPSTGAAWTATAVNVATVGPVIVA